MATIHKLRVGLLPRLSLHRPVTVAMVFIAALVLGAIAYTRVPLTMMPAGLESSRLWVHIPYRNASPAEIEKDITQPVEGVLRTMSGIESLDSRTYENGARVGVRFRDNVDMSEAYNQLRDRVDRVMAELPDEVREIRVRRWSADNWPVMWMGFPITEERPDLHQLIQEHIVRPLEQVDGVANVELWGGTPEPRVEIALIRDRMNAARVNMYSLMRQLQDDNFTVSSGWVRDNGHKLYIRSSSRFASIDEIREIPIRGHMGLKLGDVANITHAPPEQDHFRRIDGQNAVTMGIHKESTANLVALTREIETVSYTHLTLPTN